MKPVRPIVGRRRRLICLPAFGHTSMSVASDSTEHVSATSVDTQRSAKAVENTEVAVSFRPVEILLRYFKSVMFILKLNFPFASNRPHVLPKF